MISRKYLTHQTPGILNVFDEDSKIFECKSLELPWLDNKPNKSCIFEGVYVVKKIIRPNGKPGLHITDVLGRSAILIHIGNFAAGEKVDIEGCVLVGFYFIDMNHDGYLDIADSTKAFNALYSLLPNEFKLYVI